MVHMDNIHHVPFDYSTKLSLFRVQISNIYAYLYTITAYSLVASSP